MKKFTYHFNYDQATSLHYICFEKRAPITSAGHVLASAVCVQYALRLQQRLAVRWSGHRCFHIGYDVAIAIYILFSRANQMPQIDDPIQLTVLLPIFHDVGSSGILNFIKTEIND